MTGTLSGEQTSGAAPQVPPPLPPLGSDASRVYACLVEQLAEAVHAAGGTDVLVGLSGGIDSALVAALAVDALGSPQVHGLVMPSTYTPEDCIADAHALAENLGIDTQLVAIDTVLTAYDELLATSLAPGATSLTRQNLQARIRANLLMAFSNERDWLVLNTGNRTEALLGYTTLYGDTVGMFAPLAPLYKGWVYELTRFRNETALSDMSDSEPQGGGAAVPPAILTRAPSAGLAPGQTDEAELGSYEINDAICYAYDNGATTLEQLIEAGCPAAPAEAALARIEANRFKARYLPPGAALALPNL